MKPAVDHFIDCAQNEALYQPHIKILANAAFLLALLHDLRDQVLVHLGHFPDLRFGGTVDLVSFHLINHGHVPVPLEFRQMPADEMAQFVQAGTRFLDLGPEAVKYLLGTVAEKLHQNVILVFEIKIDGAVRHAGFFRDLGDR